MAIQPYEEIIAKLNNPYGYSPAQSKPAYDFADHVKTLLEKVNPKGNMLTDAAAYYADPFRKQNASDQAILDEELAKKKAEEEAAKAAKAAVGGGGMMSGGGSDSGTPTELTQEQIDFLASETPEERYARITGDWFGLKPMGMMMLDPLGTFLTYPKQKATPKLGIGQAKTPHQIWMENWEKTLPVETQVARNIQKAQMESQQALANSGWNPERTQYTSSYGTTTDSGSISSAESAGLDAARESYGYGSDANYYGD